MKVSTSTFLPRNDNYNAATKPDYFGYYWIILNEFEMNEQDILQGRLDPELINRLRKEIGADSEEQTEAAANAAVATLTTALARNADSPNGSNALMSALDRDHDGSILDDAVGILFGRKQPKNPKTVDGPGILEHIFGSKQERVAEGIGRGTGLDKNQILRILMTIAPLVLGALGKARRNQSSRVDGGGGNGILDLLRNVVLSRGNQMADGGLINRLVESDEDDGVLEDLGNLGMNAFLSRRK